MGKCMVVDCKNRSDGLCDLKRRTSFFKFPKEVRMRIAWVKAIRRQDWVPSKYSRMCSVHFEEKFIMRSENGSCSLLKNAVPTLNLPTDNLYSTKATQTIDIRAMTEPEVLISTPRSSSPLINPDSPIYDNTSDSRSSSSQSFYIDELGTPDDLGTPSTSTAVSPSESENYEKNYMNISDDDTPRNIRLKQEITRLTFLSEKRKKIIKRLQQNLRRSRKKISNLENTLVNLYEEKMVNNGEKTCETYSKKSV